MDFKVLPLFKSHFSLGRSIMTLEKPDDKITKYDEVKYPTSIFDLLKQTNINTLVLVEDKISGLLQASKYSKENKINLFYGLRLSICNDVAYHEDDYSKKRAKYIIFAKNHAGYKVLSKIWSFAAKDGFYYTPCIDFKTLKKFWTKDLKLAIPFYDSFLYLNAFNGHQHVPDLDFCTPTLFIENNDLPFDDALKNKVLEYAKVNNLPTLPAQSIYYKTKDDFMAYMSFRCIHSRGTNKKSTLDKPELSHMGSDTFSFERWQTLNS